MALKRLRQWVRPPASPLPSASEPLPPTVVEWAARLVSLLLLLALLGVVVYQGTRPPIPPTLRLEADPETASRRGDEWVLPVTIVNEGTLAIEEATAAVQLVQGNQVIEQADLSLGLLGPGESVQAELWFDAKPADYRLRLGVEGYQLP